MRSISSGWGDGMTLVRTLTGAPPRLKTPAGTCDTHMHFYSRAYPALPGTLNPPDATLADYRRVQAWLGLGLEHPIGAGIADGEKVADRDVKPDPVVLAARFENADRIAGILGQAVRQDAACRTRSDNHVIECIAA